MRAEVGSLLRIASQLCDDDVLNLVERAAAMRVRGELEADHLDGPFDVDASLRLDRIQQRLEGP